ncbi:MAG: DNA polymerase III subunit delta' [Pseudomonadota bacterium]
MTDDALPEPDRIADAPHPRETPRLFGQNPAEAAFLQAFTAGRLHHAWMLSGPRGVGKATLAWRIARFLASQPVESGGDMFGAPPSPTTLDTDPDHPVYRRSLALAEPGIVLCRRPWDEKTKRLRTAITVEEVRKLKSQFTLSATDGGWRVAIIDAMDEMNTAAANALLKLLEEPPERTVFLLVCHQPGRLLPTIRSRCRELRLSRLSADALSEALAQAGFAVDGDAEALAELSAGSAGEAVRLATEGGLALYGEMIARLGEAPNMNRAALSRLADQATGRDAVTRYDLMIRLVDLILTRLARRGATGQDAPEAAPQEAATLARLAPSPAAAIAWAELSETLAKRIGHARGVNLDPGQVMLDTFLHVDATARRLI